METLWPILSVVCLLLLLGAIGFIGRFRSLSTRVGSFACGFRRGSRPAIWKQGIAHYCVDRIDWYRTASLSFRPSQSWSRDELDLISRHPVTESDGMRVRDFSMRITCRSGSQEFELAMSDDAYSGLRSWVESAPPGRYGRVV